ncbi:MAG: hypothetical protein L6R39_001874 [Caloplaca ligustica]|nr:MAG: hypothetical protein L6R39_001874 [Caloplaca ligustica]
MNEIIPGRRHYQPTLVSSLPCEIQDEILYHTFVDSAPVKVLSQDQLETLPTTEVIPGSREIFYRYNVFHVADKVLAAFHDYNAERGFIPRDHVQHIIVTIKQHLASYDPALALRCLLDCPKLETVEIHVSTLWESRRAIARAYGQIEGVCLELANRLGKKGFQVEAEQQEQE